MEYNSNTNNANSFSASNISNKVKDLISDPQNLAYEFRKNKKNFVFWIAIIVASLIIYLCLSSKEFSFFLVLSAIFQMSSFLIILMQVHNYQNSSGISLNSMYCYLIIMITRLSSTLFYNGYLPSDTTGDWFYQFCELISLGCIGTIIFFIKRLYRETSDTELDYVDYKYLFLPSLIVAFLVHTSLNNNILTDIAWSCSMYLEAVAIYPQLYLFQTKGGQIESYTSHYVSLQGLSRLMSLIFWYYTYEELNEEMEDSYSLFHSYTGFFLIASQAIQLILMVDFYYYYIKSLYKGEAFTISNNI